jgi:phage terminase large subunit
MSELIYNDYFFDFLTNTTARLNFMRGGGGSGKSTSLHQFFCIDKFLEGNHLEILIVRKTMTSLRLTAYRKMIELLKSLRGDKGFEYNKSEAWVKLGTNLMQFSGLDDSEKIKSTEWDYIFAEELTDFTQDDFSMLNLRLKRSGSGHPQLFGAFNPIDAFHWLKTEYYDKPTDRMAFHHSTYRHNPFVNEETKENYRSLKEQNNTLWLIYSEGEWGSLESLIYSNYDIKDVFPEHFDEIIYGYDFGFSNPSAIVKIGILDTEFYIEEMLYETDLTSTKFVERLGSLGIDKNAQQFGDSNRADYIDEIYNAGYNIRGADKGAGSVIEGIDTVKRCKLHILSSSLNLLKELRAYSFKKDKNDHIIDEPVKFNDHLADALRYAIYMYMQHSQPKVYLV